MRKGLLGLLLLMFVGPNTGCDEPARPKRPPAENAEDETTEDLRERRRSGTTARDDLDRDSDSRDGRYDDDPRREERRRPDYRRRESSAAEEAEDERDAEADRPTKAD